MNDGNPEVFDFIVEEIKLYANSVFCIIISNK